MDFRVKAHGRGLADRRSLFQQPQPTPLRGSGLAMILNRHIGVETRIHIGIIMAVRGAVEALVRAQVN